MVFVVCFVIEFVCVCEYFVGVVFILGWRFRLIDVSRVYNL